MILISTISLFVVALIATYAIARWIDTEIESCNWEKRYDAEERRCAELLSLLDDADADIAFLKANTTDIFMELQASQMQFFGALQEIDELKAELEKVNHNIRKRCSHCNTFMTKDGVCNNEKCKSKKILNATEAAKIIEAGGCVDFSDIKHKSYYSLSAKNDGFIGCFLINELPSHGHCYSNSDEFIKQFGGYTFIQVYPEVMQSKENHVEAKNAVKPMLDIPDPVTEPKPILAEADVVELIKKGDVK